MTNRASILALIRCQNLCDCNLYYSCEGEKQRRNCYVENYERHMELAAEMQEYLREEHTSV